MQQYLSLCDQALNGREKLSRAGGTVGIFGHQMRFRLAEGFPLLTTKKVFTRGIFEELKWLLRGDSNIGYLKDKGVGIWDAWADENGDTGPMYPTMWRHFPNGVPTAEIRKAAENSPSALKFRHAVELLAASPDYQPIDQIQELLNLLRKKPFSRRHIVSAWHPAVLPDESISPVENVKQGRQALAACHTFFQLYVEELTEDEAVAESLQFVTRGLDALTWEMTENPKNSPAQLVLLKARYAELVEQENGLIVRTPYALENLKRKRLSLQLYQRSADLPLGVPFNIASYAALTHILADKTGMLPGDFIWTGGDCHVYLNQIDQLRDVQLIREPRPLPWLDIVYPTDYLDSIPENDFSDKFVDGIEFGLCGYDPHPEIKYPPPAV